MAVGSVNNRSTHSNLYTEKAEEKRNQAISAEEKEDKKEDKLKQYGMPKDEYISSQGKPEKALGTYRVGVDENGKQRILYERPSSEEKDSKANELSADQNSAKAKEASDEKMAEPAKKDAEEKGGATANTDMVDAEIKRLKESKQQIAQQMKYASNDPEKLKELEQQLAQINAELSQKDNDNYRRQNASVSLW